MRYHVLAVDYDGTLAHDGVVDQPTIEALERIGESGRKLVLVTGRRLEPLLEIFPRLGMFHLVVAENGAFLFNPKDKSESLIAAPPSEKLAASLARRGVEPVEYGRVIVATWRPHEHAVLEAISELSLELQIIFNKDAVMILPSGINKAVGLRAALLELGVSPLNTVAVGDAENDLTMLAACGVSVAVGNALESVKSASDIVLEAPRGAGVTELINRLLQTDLMEVDARAAKRVVFGKVAENESLELPVIGGSMLITGGPGGGKSKLAIAFLEQLISRGAQACIIDPEGDYQSTEHAVVLGTADRAPEIEEVVRALENPNEHCIVSIFAIEKKDRPDYFNRLYMGLAELRSRTGHPHWIIIDEAHYAIPRERTSVPNLLKTELEGLMLVTAYPDRVASEVLKSVEWIVCVSDDPRESMSVCGQIVGAVVASIPEPPSDTQYRALAWQRGQKDPIWFIPASTRAENVRHQHSYFEGELEMGQRFVFRGPESKLALQAKNVSIFIQLAEGVDEETWNYHLRRHDYSTWFHDVIHDHDMATNLRMIEQADELSASRSRERVLECIRERFEEKL